MNATRDDIARAIHVAMHHPDGDPDQPCRIEYPGGFTYCDGPRARDRDAADAVRALLGGEHEVVPAPPSEPGPVSPPYRAERVAAALALHQPYPDGPGSGWVAPGEYGLIEPACATCGTPGEYAVPWPCATARALLGR